MKIRGRLVAALTITLAALAAPQPPAIAAPEPLIGAIRVFSNEELYGVHSSVFATLFGQPWSADHWEYALNASVTGKGTYHGTNHHGQPFELDVLAFGPVDFAVLQLNPEERQWIAANRFSLSGVIARLEAGGQSILVHGQVVSSQAADGSTSTRFWLTNTLVDTDAYDPIATHPPLQLAEPVRNAGGDCAANCAAVRNATYHAAALAYNAALDKAANQLLIDRQAAERRLAVGLTAATAVQTATLITCAFTGPVALSCVIGASTVYAITVAGLHADFAIDMAQANDTYNNSVNSALNIRSAAEDGADLVYNACLANCGGGNAGGGGGEHLPGADVFDPNESPTGPRRP